MRDLKPALLASEHVIGDQVLVRELDEALLVVLKFSDRAFVPFDIAVDDGRPLLRVRSDVILDLLLLCQRQANGAVVLLDRCLDNLR